MEGGRPRPPKTRVRELSLNSSPISDAYVPGGRGRPPSIFSRSEFESPGPPEGDRDKKYAVNTEGDMLAFKLREAGAGQATLRLVNFHSLWR